MPPEAEALVAEFRGATRARFGEKLKTIHTVWNAECPPGGELVAMVVVRELAQVDVYAVDALGTHILGRHPIGLSLLLFDTDYFQQLRSIPFLTTVSAPERRVFLGYLRASPGQSPFEKMSVYVIPLPEHEAIMEDIGRSLLRAVAALRQPLEQHRGLSG